MGVDNQRDLIPPIGNFVTAEIRNAGHPDDTVRQGVLIDPTHLLGESNTVYPVDASKPITIVPDKKLMGINGDFCLDNTNVNETWRASHGPKKIVKFHPPVG